MSYGCPLSIERVHWAMHGREIVWVNGVCARPLSQFFESLAEVLLNLAVDGLDRAIRCQDRDQRGNAVDDLAQCEVVLHSAILRHYDAGCA